VEGWKFPFGNFNKKGRIGPIWRLQILTKNQDGWLPGIHVPLKPLLIYV